ncbi:MFS transporter [Rhodococcus oxybenzonivorans]|uniref:MFS transporter n=1 Tax=Rhodococcus oxybenzonivorans TaxID=1990687 RepID=UPI0029546F83|nr:MFS transporter [Rhodococcus oxybenzonivorans]MDV7352774.1 MFS transporter [Rhodococcus oxybenzonivorans]
MSLRHDPSAERTVTATVPQDLSRRRMLTAMVGTLLGLVLAALASTTVLTSLPVMMNELGAGQAAYTWVIVSTLLTTTISLAIWGKLCDLFSHTRLMYAAIVIFIVASLCAGLSPTAETLIGFRAVQGVGAGGLIAVGTVLLADLVSPRERGRYAGLVSGVIGVGTMGGPVLGGLITDGLGWRWNFYLGIPFAVASVILLHRTVRLPSPRGTSRIDWAGVVLVTFGAGLAMGWVTIAGDLFPWWSWQSAAMAGTAFVCAAAVIIVERRVAEPLIPLGLFADPTISRVVIASISLGVTMLTVPAFMSQYLQLSRGLTASSSGTVMLAMSVATFLTSTLLGQVISRTGRWKHWIVLGSVFLLAATVGLSTLTITTPLVLVSGYLVGIGVAIGTLMSNLQIVAQNAAPPDRLGSATALPAFFRQLASTVAISILGAVVATRVATRPGSAEMAGETVPDVATLAEPVRHAVQVMYADIVSDLFSWCIPLTVIGLIATVLLPNLPLRTSNAVEQRAEAILPD